jgi:hypothetical protein
MDLISATRFSFARARRPGFSRDFAVHIALFCVGFILIGIPAAVTCRSPLWGFAPDSDWRERPADDLAGELLQKPEYSLLQQLATSGLRYSTMIADPSS